MRGKQELGVGVWGTGRRMSLLNKFGAFGAVAATLVLAGCRQGHARSAQVPPFLSGHHALRRWAVPRVRKWPNTVGRNQLHQDSYFYTGLVDGKEGDGLPFAVSEKRFLERGQERYNVYCTPCHSRVGNGEGMIVQRGYAKAGDFHTARLEAAPLGHFFHVITNGYGAMPEYSAQVSPADRWAIVAYIRALQLSQKAHQPMFPRSSCRAALRTSHSTKAMPQPLSRTGMCP